MRELTARELWLSPIYVIMVMEKSGADTIKYESGKDSGFPDTGSTNYCGFYYSIEDAIHAMHTNKCDLRECVYNYGYVLRHMPGMYCNSADADDRIYFKWDDERQGYFESDEPAIMRRIEF